MASWNIPHQGQRAAYVYSIEIPSLNMSSYARLRETHAKQLWELISVLRRASSPNFIRFASK